MKDVNMKIAAVGQFFPAGFDIMVEGKRFAKPLFLRVPLCGVGKNP